MWTPGVFRTTSHAQGCPTTLCREPKSGLLPPADALPCPFLEHPPCGNIRHPCAGWVIDVCDAMFLNQAGLIPGSTVVRRRVRCDSGSSPLVAHEWITTQHSARRCPRSDVRRKRAVAIRQHASAIVNITVFRHCRGAPPPGTSLATAAVLVDGAPGRARFSPCHSWDPGSTQRKHYSSPRGWREDDPLTGSRVEQCQPQ